MARTIAVKIADAAKLLDLTDGYNAIEKRIINLLSENGIKDRSIIPMYLNEMDYHTKKIETILYRAGYAASANSLLVVVNSQLIGEDSLRSLESLKYIYHNNIVLMKTDV